MMLMLTGLLTGLIASTSEGAEAASEGHAWVPYAAGGGALAILLVVLAALLVFGKGREHS
jgi:hypothetical protein